MSAKERGTDAERLKADFRLKAKTFIESRVSDTVRRDGIIAAIEPIIDFIADSAPPAKDIQDRVVSVDDSIKDWVALTLEQIGLHRTEGRRSDGPRRGPKRREAPKLPEYLVPFELLWPGDPRRKRKVAKDLEVFSQRKDQSKQGDPYPTPIPIPTDLLSLGRAHPSVQKFLKDITPAAMVIHDATDLELNFRKVSVGDDKVPAHYLNSLHGVGVISIPLSQPMPNEILLLLQKGYRELKDLEDKEPETAETRLAKEAMRVRNTLKRIAQRVLAYKAVQGASYNVPDYQPDPVKIKTLDEIEKASKGPTRTRPTPTRTEDSGEDIVRHMFDDDEDGEDDEQKLDIGELPEWLGKLLADKTEVAIARGGGKIDTLIFGDRVSEIIHDQVVACERLIVAHFEQALIKEGDGKLIVGSRGTFRGLVFTLKDLESVVGAGVFKAALEGKNPDWANITKAILGVVWEHVNSRIDTNFDKALPPPKLNAKYEDALNDLEDITNTLKNSTPAGPKKKVTPDAKPAAGKTAPGAKTTAKKTGGKAGTKAAEGTEEKPAEEAPPNLEYLSKDAEVLVPSGEGATRHVERWKYAGTTEGGMKAKLTRDDERGIPVDHAIDAWELHLSNQEFKEGDTIVWLTATGQLDPNWEIKKIHDDRTTADIAHKTDSTQKKERVPLTELRELFPLFDTRPGNTSPEIVHLPKTKDPRDGWDEGWSVKPLADGVGTKDIFLSKAGTMGEPHPAAAQLRAWNPPVWVLKKTAEGLTEFEKTLTDQEKALLLKIKKNSETQFGPATDNNPTWFRIRIKFREQLPTLREKLRSEGTRH